MIDILNELVAKQKIKVEELKREINSMIGGFRKQIKMYELHYERGKLHAGVQIIKELNVEVWCVYCEQYGKMTHIDDLDDPEYDGPYYYCGNCDNKIMVKKK